MGNSSSSSGRGHHDESVDYGFLVPQGVYTGPRDWNQPVVSQLIVQRKLAPFYRPLEDYDDTWDGDQILAARKELPDPENPDSATKLEAPATTSKSGHYKRPATLKEPARPEALVYRGAVECPICFLYYPPNINHSRCCDQAICTECFVQIKRNEPTTTHIVSEPAACPYCVQDNFGIVYAPPQWRTGLGSEGMHALWADSQRASQPSPEAAPPTHKRRQKSYSADSPEVVTIDQIRPDWEQKLEAIRAAVARRANRRIIMRQVGDRLIPVGVTSGRIHALSPEEAAAAAAGAEGGASRRSRRRQAPQNGSFEQFMGMNGQDLEELMLMEAMRLSLLDHEEHQRKEAEEKKKQGQAAAASTGGEDVAADTADGTAGSGPGPSTLEARSTVNTSSSSNLSSSPSSVQRSPSPQLPSTHREAESQDSLAPGRRSWSLSRSRTPPPPVPIPNIPLSEENSAAWHNRPSGPPAFSTLSAALTSTSTASAFLGTSPSGSAVVQKHSRSSTPEPSSHKISPALPEPSGGRPHSPIPTITVDNNTGHATSHDGDNEQPPMPPRKDSEGVTSSTVNPGASLAGASTYVTLVSIPDPGVSHSPLLDLDAASKSEVTTSEPQLVTSSIHRAQ